MRASTSLAKPRVLAGALTVLLLLIAVVLLVTPPAAARSRDQAPPKFDGLVSAWACVGGPIWDGRMTSYHLSWDPATDNRTRQHQIVYYVYVATKPGGQDFTQPYNWTSPGATSFDTDPLPTDQDVYFVVRAQDRAGNVDSNTVERVGMNVCD